MEKKKVSKLPDTWAQICKIQGIDPNVFPSYDHVEERFRRNQLGDWKLMHLVEALNSLSGKKYKADYSKGNQKKWFPVMLYDVSVSAFRFWSTRNEFTTAYTSTGARHVFESPELAEHAGTAFPDIYNEVMMP
jgi:hypothetical protein